MTCSVRIPRKILENIFKCGKIELCVLHSYCYLNKFTKLFIKAQILKLVFDVEDPQNMMIYLHIVRKV